MKQSIVNILEENIIRFPLKKAYVHVDGKEVEEVITYEELGKLIKKVAGYLQMCEAKNERVLLLLPSGLDYIISLLGCIYAHAIGIPAYPVRNTHNKERLDGILKSSDAKYIIVDSQNYKKITDYVDDEDINILTIQEILDYSEECSWKEDSYKGDEVAYLQYTSGSTRDAKGAMITHENIVDNERMLQKVYDLSHEDVIISWLPFYHDMGLIGNLLLTVYLGASCVFMSPVSFVQSPKTWIQCISQYKGTYVTAPNFAYQMCVNNINDEDLKDLNLSSLRNAVNGAEPVRLNTLHEFEEKYFPYGLKKGALNPSYGLAENTLIATGHDQLEEYHYITLDEEALKKNQVIISEYGQQMVSSGRAIEGEEIKIVDKENNRSLPEGNVGEIWIHSKSVTKGYWNLEEINEVSFTYDLEGDSRRYFRTGDLGFLLDGYIYITGRLKDLIIIRGKNYYPQDIEYLSECTADELIKDSSAAFSIIEGEEEKLVVIVEVSKSLRHLSKSKDPEKEKRKAIRMEEITNMIYNRIVRYYQIEPHNIVLIQERSIPKTSSGKIQRQLCKKYYLDNSLISWSQLLA